MAPECCARTTAPSSAPPARRARRPTILWRPRRTTRTAAPSTYRSRRNEEPREAPRCPITFLARAGPYRSCFTERMTLAAVLSPSPMSRHSLKNSSGACARSRRYWRARCRAHLPIGPISLDVTQSGLSTFGDPGRAADAGGCAAVDPALCRALQHGTAAQRDRVCDAGGHAGRTKGTDPRRAGPQAGARSTATSVTPSAGSLTDTVTMVLPGETEAGSAGKQPCRGIARRPHTPSDR